MPPEDIRVRVMSAITLGRMHARESVGDLKLYNSRDQWTRSSLSNASLWALCQINGDKLPGPPEAEQKNLLNWFLVPAKPDQ
jgi:hypothetical protein